RPREETGTKRPAAASRSEYQLGPRNQPTAFVNVLVVTNAVSDGSHVFGDFPAELARQFNATNGVAAEILRLPCNMASPARWTEEIFIARSLRATNVDRVIGLQFPSYLIPHEQKTIWQIADEWPWQDQPEPQALDEIRFAFTEAQNSCFR